MVPILFVFLIQIISFTHFKMAELTKLVANRKDTRSRVTRSFSEREYFKDFTPVQREVEV